MRDVKFDISYLSELVSSSSGVENDVHTCTYEFEENTKRVGNALLEFKNEGKEAVSQVQSCISQINGYMQDLEDKRKLALSRKQTEYQRPPMPTIDESCPSEKREAIMTRYHREVMAVDEKNAQIRRYNEEIDRYVKSCDEAKLKLESIVSAQLQIVDSINKEIGLATEIVNDFLERSYQVIGKNSTINSAISGFKNALGATYESAIKIYQLDPRDVRTYSFASKQFVIKNNKPQASGIAQVSTPYEEEELPKDEEFHLTEKSLDTLLTDTGTIKKIKLQSINLHKLGGKVLISRLSDLGYEIVKSTDGSMIDSCGLIHLEKKND